MPVRSPASDPQFPPAIAVLPRSRSWPADLATQRAKGSVRVGSGRVIGAPVRTSRSDVRLPRAGGASHREGARRVSIRTQHTGVGLHRIIVRNRRSSGICRRLVGARGGGRPLVARNSPKQECTTCAKLSLGHQRGCQHRRARRPASACAEGKHANGTPPCCRVPLGRSGLAALSYRWRHDRFLRRRSNSSMTAMLAPMMIRK